MATPKKNSKKKPNKNFGRKQVEIDWNKVDSLLEAGCLGTEIAANFDCCADTLYDRCLEVKGVLFSYYSRQKKSKGNSMLRFVQFNQAVIEADRGMLIWLGKQRLSQSDDPKETREFNGKLAETLDLLKSLKPSDEKETQDSKEKLIETLEVLKEISSNESDKQPEQQTD